jgi:hypothetical protein
LHSVTVTIAVVKRAFCNLAMIFRTIFAMIVYEPMAGRDARVGVPAARLPWSKAIWWLLAAALERPCDFAWDAR